MNVDVDKSRHDEFARGVNDCICAGTYLSDLREFSVGYKDVAFGVETIGRVYHVSIFYQEFRTHIGSGIQLTFLLHGGLINEEEYRHSYR